MATMTFEHVIPVSETLTGEYLKDKDGNIYFLAVVYDEDPLNPREDGCLSHMLCWHNRYDIGDANDFESLNDVIEQLENDKSSGDDYITSPLFLLDHSGISISIHDFNDHWDSGLVGIVYVKKSELLNEGISLKNDWKETAKNIIESEVSLYDQYLRGDVYGYRLFQLTNSSWEETDSCWGFFGSDVHENGMLDQLGLEGVEVLDYESEKDL